MSKFDYHYSLLLEQLEKKEPEKYVVASISHGIHVFMHRDGNFNSYLDDDVVKFDSKEEAKSYCSDGVFTLSLNKAKSESNREQTKYS